MGKAIQAVMVALATPRKMTAKGWQGRVAVGRLESDLSAIGEGAKRGDRGVASTAGVFATPQCRCHGR